VIDQDFWITPLTPDERQTLKLFCETVSEIETYPLYQKLLRHNVVNSDLKVRDGLVVDASIRDLDENDVRSFILTARLFGQNNERISIRNVSDIVERRVSKRLVLWMNFNAYREGWNEFGKQTLPRSGDTMGGVFDVFLYGHYAHKNPEKEAIYEQWKRTADGFVARKSAFLIALGAFFWLLQGMRQYVDRLLVSEPFGTVLMCAPGVNDLRNNPTSK